mgnify:CR=1 FL=1
MQTLRNAENTRSFNNDKSIIHLPRQYVIIWGQMPMIIIPA